MTSDWPLTLKCQKSTLNTYRRGPDFTMAPFGDISSFAIGYKQKMNVIFLEKKIRNFKKKLKPYVCGEHWQENSGDVWKYQRQFEGGVVFWNICSNRTVPIGSHVNINGKNRESRKTCFLFFKNSKLVRAYGPGHPATESWKQCANKQTNKQSVNA